MNILVYVFWSTYVYAFLLGSVLYLITHLKIFFFFLVPETLDLVVLKVLVLKGGMFPRKHGFNEF